MKAEGHLGRCYLKGRAGDAANVILTAVGYNLRLVLAWLRMILRLLALLQIFAIQPQPSNRLLNGRLSRFARLGIFKRASPHSPNRRMISAVPR
jgi:IS5 family transposase